MSNGEDEDPILRPHILLLLQLAQAYQKSTGSQEKIAAQRQLHDACCELAGVVARRVNALLHKERSMAIIQALRALYSLIDQVATMVDPIMFKPSGLGHVIAVMVDMMSEEDWNGLDSYRPGLSCSPPSCGVSAEGTPPPPHIALAGLISIVLRPRARPAQWWLVEHFTPLFAVAAPLYAAITHALYLYQKDPEQGEVTVPVHLTSGLATYVLTVRNEVVKAANASVDDFVRLLQKAVASDTERTVLSYIYQLQNTGLCDGMDLPWFCLFLLKKFPSVLVDRFDLVMERLARWWGSCAEADEEFAHTFSELIFGCLNQFTGEQSEWLACFLVKGCSKEYSLYTQVVLDLADSIQHTVIAKSGSLERFAESFGTRCRSGLLCEAVLNNMDEGLTEGFLMLEALGVASPRLAVDIGTHLVHRARGALGIDVVQNMLQIFVCSCGPSHDGVLEGVLRGVLGSAHLLSTQDLELALDNLVVLCSDKFDTFGLIPCLGTTWRELARLAESSSVGVSSKAIMLLENTLGSIRYPEEVSSCMRLLFRRWVTAVRDASSDDAPASAMSLENLSGRVLKQLAEIQQGGSLALLHLIFDELFGADEEVCHSAQAGLSTMEVACVELVSRLAASRPEVVGGIGRFVDDFFRPPTHIRPDCIQIFLSDRFTKHPSIMIFIGILSVDPAKFQHVYRVVLRPTARHLVTLWKPEPHAAPASKAVYFGLTCRLFSVLAAGKVLPGPLGSIMEAFGSVSCGVLARVVRLVWEYLENIEGVPDPTSSTPTIYNTLKSLVLAEFEQLGPWYPQLFSSEEVKPTE